MTIEELTDTERIYIIEEWISQIPGIHNFASHEVINTQQQCLERRVSTCLILCLPLGSNTVPRIYELRRLIDAQQSISRIDEYLTELEKLMRQYKIIDKLENLLSALLHHLPGAFHKLDLINGIDRNIIRPLERAMHIPLQVQSLLDRIVRCEKSTLALEMEMEMEETQSGGNEFVQVSNLMRPMKSLDERISELKERIRILGGDTEGIDLL